MDSGFDRVQRLSSPQEREKNLFTNRSDNNFADSMQVEKARESVAAIRDSLMQNRSPMDKKINYDFGELTNYRDKGL